MNTSIEATASFFDALLGDADVDFYDLDAVFQDTLAMVPEATRRTRCIDAAFDCAMNPTNYLFYDDIHPTEWVHAGPCRRLA